MRLAIRKQPTKSSAFNAKVSLFNVDQPLELSIKLSAVFIFAHAQGKLLHKSFSINRTATSSDENQRASFLLVSIQNVVHRSQPQTVSFLQTWGKKRFEVKLKRY